MESQSPMLAGPIGSGPASHTAFIDGRETPMSDARWIDSFDPSTGQVVARVADSPAEVVDAAVCSAHAAHTEWSAMLPMERERVLHRLADLVEEHADELAGYDALESGKPVTYVRAVDLGLAVEQFRYYAGWPSKIQGATLPVESPAAHAYTRRVPYGVVAAITPWNFPLCQAAIKLAPALAAGNTAVIKPSELTSLSTLRLAELAIEAGLPAGVLNVVTGAGATTGDALVRHPLVDKVTFTGSERVGRLLGRQATGDLKHVSLELGGKNPHVIFADADLGKATESAATTAFFYTGQVCFAGSRLLVERPVFDEVLAGLEKYARSLVLGPGPDPASTVGPLSSAAQRDRVESYVDGAVAGGARIAFGGRRPEARPDGYFYEPTAVVGCADDDAIVTEEVFGPVVTVQPFDSVQEVVERTGRIRHGLTAGVWTRDLARAHTVAAALPAGTTWVNTYGDFSATAPWGGVNDSGLGRDCGPEGLDAYLRTRTTWVSLG